MTRANPPRLSIAAGLAIAFAAGATPAQAHLAASGMGPIYDGLMHFLTSPEDVVPALALALLAGLRGADFGRRALFVLPAAWLVGGLAGLAAASMTVSPAITAATFILLGGLVVFDVKISLRATTALAALLGLAHGYLNGAGMGQPVSGALALTGLSAAVFVLVALVGALVVRLPPTWPRVAVRVIGSWIVASGMLLLGWNLSGKM